MFKSQGVLGAQSVRTAACQADPASGASPGTEPRQQRLGAAPGTVRAAAQDPERLPVQLCREGVETSLSRKDFLHTEIEFQNFSPETRPL